MNSKKKNVQNSDIEKLDVGGAARSPYVRRIIHKRLRELKLKGFGISLKYSQKDQQGSEEI